LPNYTAPPFEDASVPTNQLVLPGGSINPSFASPNSASGMPVAPTKPTVRGEVITNTHVNNADFAGFFAANTTGVFVGQLPP